MKKKLLLCSTMIFSSPVFAGSITCSSTLYTCEVESGQVAASGDDVKITTTDVASLTPKIQGYGVYLNSSQYHIHDITISTSGGQADGIRSNGNPNSLFFSNGLVNIKTTGSSADGINLGVKGGSTSSSSHAVVLAGDSGVIEAEGIAVRANNNVGAGFQSIIILGNDYTIKQTGKTVDNSFESDGYAIYAGNRDDDISGFGTMDWLLSGKRNNNKGDSYVLIGDNATITSSGVSNSSYKGAAVYANKGGVIQLGDNASITAPSTSYYLYASTEKQNKGKNNASETAEDRAGTILLKGGVTFNNVASLDEVVMMSKGANSLIKSGYVDYSYNATDGSNISIGDQITSSSGKYTIQGALNAMEGGEIDLSMSDNSSFTGSTKIDNSLSKINLAIDGQNSVWDIAKDSSLTTLKLTNGANLLAYDVNNIGSANYTLTADTVDNGGVIDLSNNTTGDVFTIKGNYVSNGGFLKLDTALGDDSSLTDKLVIDGNATTGVNGATKVVIANIGGTGAQTIEGIQVVNVVNGTSSADAFVKAGRIVAGLYDYNLVQGNASGTDTQGWYLTSYLTPPTPTPTPTPIIRPEAGSYLGNLVAANTMFNLRLHDRLGETQYTDLLTGEKKVTSMWLRYQYGQTKFDAAGGQLDIKNTWNITQLGGDLAQWTTDGTNRLHLGAMVGYGRSTNDADSSLTHYRSKGKVDGYSVGLYGTWYDNESDKTGLYVDTWATWNDFNATVHGESLNREKYDLSGFTASVESGYTFLAKQAENYNFWLQPKGQLTWMGVDADNHTESNGTKVRGNGDNLQTRLGLRATLSTGDSQNLAIDRSGQVFVETNWIYNTEPFEVKMDGVKIQQQGTRNVGEIKGGVEWNLHKNTSAWFNIAYQSGDHSYEDLGLMIGAKYAF